jgi:hypothetical protein
MTSHGIDIRESCGVIFTRSRKDCGLVANKLDSSGITAMVYHAKLEPHEKIKAVDGWTAGRKSCAVTTIALIRVMSGGLCGSDFLRPSTRGTKRAGERAVMAKML